MKRSVRLVAWSQCSLLACPDVANVPQIDRDDDGRGDACDADPDDPDDNGPADGRTAGSYGHPSIVTFDGMRYLFHGAGDYRLAESDDGQFVVQARLGRAFGMRNVSFNRALVAKVGGSMLAFADQPVDVFDPIPVTLDGQALDVPEQEVVDLPGGATIRRVTRCSFGCDAYQVDWATGEMLQVGANLGDDYILDVPPARFGRMRGLLGDADGNRNNDNVTPDGQAVNLLDRDELYDVFADSWLLDQGESLFQSEPSADEVTPLFPTSQITLADLPADDVAAAEAQCRAAGVAPGAGLEQCAFDVAITGSSAWIASAVAIADLVADSVPAAITQMLDTQPRSISVGDLVAGSLDQPFAVDAYRFSGSAGEELALLAVEPCFGPASGQYDVFTAAGARLGSGSIAGRGYVALPPLPHDGDYTVVVHDTGGYVGPYAFTLRPANLLPNPNSATTSNGGRLEVQIVAPAAGPIQAGPIEVSGLAGVNGTIGEATVVYVVDVSGSTESSGHDCNGDGIVDAADNGNPAVDARNGTVLDCELIAIKALNNSLGVSDTDVALVVFGSDGAAADLGPADDDQPLTGPATDADNSGRADIEEALESVGTGNVDRFSPVRVGSGTDFVDALDATVDLLAGRSEDRPTYVFFLSDGRNGLSESLTERVQALADDGVRIDTFAIGSGGIGCWDGSAMRAISSGACVDVVNPSDLTVSLTALPEDLAAVAVSVDNGSDLPATVNALGQWMVTLPALPAGSHVIRATATATDGTESATEVLVEVG